MIRILHVFILSLALLPLKPSSAADWGCPEANEEINKCQAAILAAKRDIERGIDTTRAAQAAKAQQGQAGALDAGAVEANSSYSATLRLNKAQAACAEMTKNVTNEYWKTDRTKNPDPNIGTCVSVCDQAEASARSKNIYGMQLVNASRNKCIQTVRALQSELDKSILSLNQAGVQGGRAVSGSAAGH